MQVAVTKNHNNTWNIVPLEGAFEGQLVAVADAINMADVQTNGRELVGTLKAVWGLAFDREMDLDASTIRGLAIGKRFDACAEIRLEQYSEGFMDRRSARFLRGAKKIMVFGASVFGKGIY